MKKVYQGGVGFEGKWTESRNRSMIANQMDNQDPLENEIAIQLQQCHYILELEDQSPYK